MKLKYIFLAFLFAFSAHLAKGQAKTDKDKIIELFAKSKKVYESRNVFKLNVSYKMFLSNKSDIPSEKYDGTFIKKNSDYYSKISNTEFVKIKNCFIKIDNDSKLIEFKKEIKTESPIYDLTGILSNFNAFKLTSDGDYWICTMTAPEITFVPYGKAVVAIHKTNYTLSRQILYLLNQSTHKNINGKKTVVYPRLEITFSDTEAKTIPLGTKFSVNTYVIESNKKLIPSKNYKNYKIVN